MEEKYSSETLLTIYYTTRYHKLEDYDMNYYQYQFLHCAVSVIGLMAVDLAHK
jgi:hypothetical protein